MRLAVSNIAWDPSDEPAILDALTAAGVTGIEVAPTKLWPDWNGATEAAASRSRDAFAARGFAVPALQSILFGRPLLHVFGDPASRAALVDHIGQVARIAGALGAGAMVFGSPRNRLRGPLSEAAAMDAAVPLFRRLGEVCAEAGTCLCIEANPRDYGGDFLLTWRDAAELVARCDHHGIGLHLDTACTAMAGDDPVAAVVECGARLRHFHVSAPQLGPVGLTPPGHHPARTDEQGMAIDHAAIGAALRSSGYAGWVSIEMRRTDDPIASVSRAVEFARAHYG